MASHRYWRIRFFDSPSGGTRNRVYECELKSVRGGSDDTGSGTPTASSVFSGSAANAFDNDTGTFLEFNEQQSGDLQYDFGSGNDQVVTEVTLRTSTANNSPWGLRIEGSDDASTWVVYAIFEDLSWGSSETKTFVLGPMNPKPRITAIAPTSVTISGTYLDAGGNAQESAQWQLEEATGDFSTPLADTGETTSDKLSHTFSSLTAQTVYRARVRMKESGDSTWGEWGYLWFRTPEFTSAVHDSFASDDLGDWPPTGWSQNPNFSGGGAMEDPEQFYKIGLYNTGLWNSEHEAGYAARIANNATWGGGTHGLTYGAFNQADMRVVGLVNRSGSTSLAMIFGARMNYGASTATGYMIYFDTSGNMKLRRIDSYLGSGADLDSDASPTNWTTMVPRFFLIEVEGSTIRGKYWDVDEAEPASFAWEVTDSTYSAAGYPMFDGDSASASALIDWIQIEFMTSQVPVQPTVTVASKSESDASFTTSAFSGGSGTHQDTRWEVATDVGFTNKVQDVVSSTDLVAHTVSGLSPSTTYYVRATFRDDANQAGLASDPVSFTTDANPGVGDPPELTVGLVGATTITVGVETDSLYLSVEYRIRLSGTVVEQTSVSGPTRFSYQFTGLTANTEYAVSARVVRAEGTSPWSTETAVTTLVTDIDPGDLLGCPPSLFGYLWNPDANPVDWQTRRGYGFFTPYAGEPLRGITTCRLRYPAGGATWTIYISDDLGATYSPIASGVDETTTDGDGLHCYDFALDTTLYSDGADYRLKAISSGAVEIESLSFLIDNAGAAVAWSNREGVLDNDRYATLWYRRKGLGVWGGEDPGGLIWRQASNEKSILQYRGGPFSAFVDTTVPTTAKGGDVTLRIYLWSGEGGFAHQQSRIDLEGWYAGVGFFVDGYSDQILGALDATGGWSPPPEGRGLYVGLNSIVATALGCCDEFNVSTQGTYLSAIAKPSVSDGFSAMQHETDTFRNSNSLKVLERLHGKHSHSLFKYLTAATKALFVDRYVWWRDGPTPGEKPAKAATCGRRYEMIVLRVRAEVDDVDATKVRIRTRVDHAGVEPPASGYWHSDDTWVAESAFASGVLAILGNQHARTTYGAANGSRDFISYSMLPLNPAAPPSLPPAEVPTEIPETVAGEPCTLVLQAFEEDRENLKWEVGTDRAHVLPYLIEPEHYGEQEIDVISGAATIAQVDVIVVDKAQTVADQDSGWLSEMLSDGGKGVIQGRRFKLIRYISVELGWVTIADGPAGTPRLDDSFAAYRWTIRDTRDTERRIQAFIETNSNTFLPLGVYGGFGQSKDPITGDTFWVVDPTEPIVGQFFYLYDGTKREIGYVDFGTHWSGSYHYAFGLQPDTQTVARELAIPEDVYKAGAAEIETTDGKRPVYYSWPDLEVYWRAAGTADAWKIVNPTHVLTSDRRTAVPRAVAESTDVSLQDIYYGRNLFRAFTGQSDDIYGRPIDRAVRWIHLRGVDVNGDPVVDGQEYPEENQLVEIIVRYRGRPTEFAPLHIEFKETISYLFLPQEPGDYATTTDHPVFDITTSISLQARIALVDWTNSQVIFSKWTSSSGPWFLGMAKGGFIQLTYRNASGTRFDVLSTIPVPYVAGAEGWVRGDVDTTTGTVYFYRSGDGLSWWSVGDPVVVEPGGTVLGTSPDDINIGQPAAGIYAMNGSVFEIKVFDGLTLVYHPDFTQFEAPVLSFPDSASGLTVTIEQTTAGEAVAEIQITGVPYTTGELLRDLYDGVFSPRDSVTGALVDSGIRYDEGAVLAMRDPVRMRITETIPDVRDWAEKNVYAPTGWIPALDNDLRISPVSQVPPADFSVVPVVEDGIVEPVPNWDGGETIVNVLNFVYYRLVKVEPELAKSADRIELKKVEIEFRDETSIVNHGEKREKYETEVFMANGDPQGNAAIDLIYETGYQHAVDRKLYVFDRYVDGAQTVHVPVRRSASATWRPGDWVVIDLSWIPDYVTKRRGGIFGGQILAIRDVDCAWRIILFEEALPIAIS